MISAVLRTAFSIRLRKFEKDPHERKDFYNLFGLMHKESGKLVHVEHVASRGILSRNFDEGYQLTEDADHPVFKVDTVDELNIALYESPSLELSKPTCPGWGQYDRADLEPVRVVETRTMEPVELPRSLKFRGIERRTIPWRIGQSYAGGLLAEAPESTCVFWLVEFPEGETLESVKKLEGTSFFDESKYLRRTMYKALPAPEEYVDLLKGKPGGLLLVSDYLPIKS